MPVVSFSWNAQLVSLRREVVPTARWEKRARAWTMSAGEADLFLQAVQARMSLVRFPCQVSVDGVVWVLGFAPGTPYRLDAQA